MRRMRRVLIVDDSRAIRTLLVQSLQENGYTAVEAESAEDALDIALRDPPDAMVIDYFLPDRSGADLTRAFRAFANEKLGSVPIIGLSGSRGTEQPLLDAGASCFIAKPFHEAQLLEALTRALDVSAPRRAVP